MAHSTERPADSGRAAKFEQRAAARGAAQRVEEEGRMSARIVVNLEQGLTQSAIDHSPSGGTWLSLWQGPEVVIVKLSRPSLQALWQTLTKELGPSAGEKAGEGAGDQAPAGATASGRGAATAWQPPLPEPRLEPRPAER
jgi:hypothetical protein